MSGQPLIAVPCKSLAFGKSRLAGLLDQPERESLCRGLLANTLRLAAEVAGKNNVRLVSSDAEAKQIAAAQEIATDATNWPDLNAALSGVRQHVLTSGAWTELLVLPIDIPLATKESLRTVIADDAVVTIVPDGRESGTNVLKLREPSLREFQFAYGDHSFKVHGDAAIKNGWKLSIHRLEDLSFDIDNPEDYLRWKKM